ncbi:MAG: tetratricopeptide repeat protein [Motiliproteus sp.]
MPLYKLAIAHQNLGGLLSSYEAGQSTLIRQRCLFMNPMAFDKAMKLFHKAERLVQRGRPLEAVLLYRKGLKLLPDNADVLNNFANLLTSLNRCDEAVEVFKKAIQIDPKSAHTYANFGSALASLGMFQQAIEKCQCALEVDPTFVQIYGQLGFWLSSLGQNKLALEYLQRAMQHLPHDRWIYTLYLLALNYSDDLEPHEQFEAHAQWYRNFFVDNFYFQPSFVDQLTCDRPLNIGYLSADFRHHSVAFFIEPIIQGHDRTKIKCFCYSNNTRDDEVSKRIKKGADVWHSVAALNDEQLYELIRKDKIDILVDLNGHTGGNRLALFARRPAPIQVTYLGYPNTTGMEVMDYRITDDLSDPSPSADSYYSETLIRLKQGFLCYSPPGAAPTSSKPPVLEKGWVTYGSFNNVAKLSPTTINLWARVLKQTPHSQLLLKGKAFNDPQTRAYFVKQFEDQGVAGERLRLIGHAKSFEQHMALYDDIDIALDTFPYHGVTTTFEALWMGVPVISRIGNTHASRVGKSILSVLGLDELTADCDDHFIRIATLLAEDKSRLHEYRKNLRGQLQSSPLMDERGFVAKLEEAYRSIWQALLDRKAGS